MRFCSLLVCLAALSIAGVSHSSPIPDSQKAKSWSGPYYFTSNSGQYPHGVKYAAKSQAYALELTDNAVAIRLPDGEALGMEFPSTTLAGQPAADPSGHFSRVRYNAPFPGIHLDIYWKDGEVEYDWIVEPGADPSLIRVSFAGAEGVRLDKNGDLQVDTRTGYARHRSPRIYQDVDGVRKQIAGGFRLDRSGGLGYWIGDYDRSRELIIDPQLVWSARFGGYIRTDDQTIHELYTDAASGIAVDRAGNTYVTGTAVSSQLPLVHPLESACMSNHCIFVTKIAPDGKSVLYSSLVAGPGKSFPIVYFAGDPPEPIPAAIVTDLEGNVYVTGPASAAPRVGGGTLPSSGGDDALLVKLDPNGVVQASMLIGGSGDDQGTSITLGPDGYLYVAGTTQSADFPVTPNAYRTRSTGPSRFFTLKIDPKALVGEADFSSAVVYSAVLGTYSQSSSNIGLGFPMPKIGADAMGNTYVSIYTDCTGTLATPGAVQAKCQANAGSKVGMVVKLNPSGTNLLWAAMPTGSGTSFIGGLEVTPDGYTYIAGTTSSGDFPVTSGAFNATSPTNGFVAKLNPEGTALVYASYLGQATAPGAVTGIALDGDGDAYVGGGTSSAAQFPTLNSIESSLENCCAGFVTVFKPDGSGLVWSTLLGYGGEVDAITVDRTGNVYAAGYGLSPSANVTVFDSGKTIDVVKIAPAGRPIPIDGIANAASFQPGLPMSGGLASMFVHGPNFSGTVQANGTPLPSELAGVSMLINGIPAPILSVSDLAPQGKPGSQQINFQVPFEANVQRLTNVFGYSAAALTSVELRYQGLSSFGLPLTTAPGIFTLPDGSGAIQHATDYSLVTPQNPAEPGEVIIVYVTGLGPVRPAVDTGSAATGPSAIIGSYTSPTVNVGDVLYAGLTPGAPGLYQMNVRLARDLPSGVTQMYITWPFFAILPELKTEYLTAQSNSVALPVR